MIDIKTYLASGIVEQYCIGLASENESKQLLEYCKKYPEIRLAVNEAQGLMEGFLKDYERPAPQFVEEKLLDGVEDLKFDAAWVDAETQQLNEFIAISKHSNIDKWQKLIKSIKAPDTFDNYYTHRLFRNRKERLFVVWVKTDIPDETHDYIDESFLILEGSCTCQVKDKFFDLEPGGFLRMPLDGYHNLKVTSKEPVKLILSRVKVA